MAQTFEDLVAWQKAREFTRRIYAATRGVEFDSDRALRNQIQRASVSIMSNIAEGFERYRDGEFHQYLSTSKASCAEVRSHLYVALDVEYISPETFTSLSDEAREIARTIGALRKAVQIRIETEKAPKKKTVPSQHSAPSTQHKRP